MGDKRRYRTFLVRLWSVGRDGGQIWRASLHDVHTGESEAFADPSTMIDFLADRVRRLPEFETGAAASGDGSFGDEDHSTIPEERKRKSS